MKLKAFVVSMFVALLFVTGCQDNNEEVDKTTENEINNNEEVETTEEDTDFPVTIESADKEVEIKERPQNILPLSLDVAEIVLELVDADRVVAIPGAIEDPQLSTQTEKAELIEKRVSSAVNIDPEEILSFNTDLLLLTKMHGQEEDASEVLSGIDLPILTFNTMGSVETLLENIESIGKAVGETENATQLIEEMQADIETIQSKIPEDSEAPSVLVLSEVGPGTGPFMMGPGNISYDLIQLAGATPAVDKIDLKGSTPASIEQVLKMDPDYLFLLDFVGKGDEVFTDLTDNPGWSSLTAIQEDRVKVLDVKYLMNPNVKVVEGLDIMVDWIYGLDE